MSGAVEPQPNDDGSVTFGLVMPFVACVSHGGPYDDTAFVAGAQYGQIDGVLRLLRPMVHTQYVYPALVAQLDLLAMQLGYVMKSIPWEEHPDEWVAVHFVRASAQQP